MRSDKVRQSNKKDTDTNNGVGVSTVTSIFTEHFLVKNYTCITRTYLKNKID